MTYNPSLKTVDAHPNDRLCQYIDKLPPEYAKIFMQQVQLQCFGASSEVGSNQYWRFKNWQQKKAVVPLEYRPTINKIARSVFKKYLNELYAQQDSDHVVLLQLFNPINTDDMKTKTTIRVERARKGISQKELGDEVGVSTIVISRIEKMQYPGIKLDLAVKIANYFGLKMEDFEELQAILNQNNN